MGSIYETVGFLIVQYIFIKCVYHIARFLYTSFIGDVLGHTPDYKCLGKWVVITGATDGIGKAYAMEFARRGLDIVLISRTLSKLEKVAEEIKQKHSVDVKTIQMDFTKGVDAYTNIKAELDELDIAALVNNVGMNYDHPEYFSTIPSDQYSSDVINCNALSATMMTRIVLPGMQKKNKGVILVMSSFAAVMPVALLVQYSATKTYTSVLSSGLRTELNNTNIIVQNITPAFVCSNMSKMSTPRLFVPSASQFVRAQLRTVGLEHNTFGCPSHKIQGLAAHLGAAVLPDFLMRQYYYDRMKAVRSRAHQRKQKKAE